MLTIPLYKNGGWGQRGSQTMETNSESRSIWIDNLSGVLITYCVLVYHLPSFVGTGGTAIRLFFRGLLGFFIAWFFFKSGMFYKKRTVKEELLKCWRRLLIPFLVINAICFLIRVFLFNDGSFIEILKTDLYRESDVMCNPLWFCLSLSIVRILYQLFKNDRIRPIVVLFSFISAFLLNHYSYSLASEHLLSIPPWIGNIFLGFFFYGLGDYLRNIQFNKTCFIISGLLYLLFQFFPNSLDFYKNATGNNYLLSVLFDLSGIILFNNLFKLWMNRQMPLLTHIGANSMVYYITHYTFFYLLFMDHVYEAPEWVVFVVAVILTILFLLLMDKLLMKTRMRWLIGA